MQEKDRVAETATEAGTGSITLAGAITGHQSFATAYGSGGSTEVHYGIVHDDTGEWEVGIGTFLGTTNQLQRDLVLDGTSGGSNVSFAAGNKTVYVPRVAEATQVMRARRPADVVLSLRAAAGQTGYLLAGYNSAGSAAFKLNSSGGINFGSRTVADPLDVNKHVALYGDDYGISISSGRLNVVAQGSVDFYTAGSSTVRIDANSMTVGTPSPTVGQNGVTIGANSLAFQAANGLAGTVAFLTANFGSTRQYFFRRDGVAEIGATGFRFNAKQDGTETPGYLTCTAGAAGFVLQSGSTTGAIYSFRDTTDAVVGRIEPDDNTVPQPQTILTRRKGDARFAAISSARFKPGAAEIEYVDVTRFALKGWMWGGELDRTHPRYGRPGSGFIAEEVAEILPSAVIPDANGVTTGLDALTLVAHLAAHVASIEDRLAALEQESP